MKRRNFVIATGVLSTATAGLSFASPLPESIKRMARAKGMTIVFQGDSITDAGRDKGDYYANAGSGMGRGYVFQIVTDLLGEQPEAELKCYNRGISGHKVFQLADRWEIDCMSLKPDVLSILIGVNDYWHMLNGRYDGTVDIYENDFRELLKRTKDELPDVKLMIGEPFAVTGGTAINDEWKAFAGYRDAARKVAKEFSAIFIPYQEIFDNALKHAPASYWCPDGVHPSMAGGHLMKKAWLKAFSTI